MSESQVNETPGVIVDATDAMIATLSTRLDALLASWQHAIDAKREDLVPIENAAIRTPAEVLTELERDLARIESRCADQRDAADNEARQAADWERRAMEAVRNGRDDLARDALAKHSTHGNSAAQLDATARELEAVRDSYRNAVSAVRATIPSR